MTGIPIHRHDRERPFRDRDSALARLVMEELRWLFQTGRLDPPLPGLDESRPRL